MNEKLTLHHVNLVYNLYNQLIISDRVLIILGKKNVQTAMGRDVTGRRCRAGGGTESTGSAGVFLSHIIHYVRPRHCAPLSVTIPR